MSTPNLEQIARETAEKLLQSQWPSMSSFVTSADCLHARQKHAEHFILTALRSVAPQPAKTEDYSKVLDAHVARLAQEFDRNAGNPVRRELAWRNVLKEFAAALTPYLRTDREPVHPHLGS